ncbi:MAG: Tim44/TimA family putative adaptor protein [Pseudomonadota bacterium]|nr:Tim44/TimA family putative adaptor protein [Pseudomonadota bacterium]
MGNPFDPLNIILIVIAVVGFIRLRMILGRRTGNEDPIGRKKNPLHTKEEKIINISPSPIKNKKNLNKDEVIEYLENNISNFDRKKFIEGAKNVYKLILKSYAEGDLRKIKGFISKDVFEGFDKAIKDRKNKEHKLVNEIIEFDKCEVSEAILNKKEAIITVEFYTRLISYAVDENETIIAGNKDNPHSVIDYWTFKKSLKDKSPIWMLITTESET